MQYVEIKRYEDNSYASSKLNHLDDALEAIQFLTSRAFVADQLQTRHGMARAVASDLAKRICAHAALADDYARLGLSSKPAISFLPLYYCVLNLAKVCSLAGKYSADFDKHSKWHGATYNSRKKSSQGLLTEQITVKNGGALALFYKTLTGRTLSRERTIDMATVYPLVPGISAERSFVTGQSNRPLVLTFQGEITGKNLLIEVEVLCATATNPIPYEGSLKLIPFIADSGFRRIAGSLNRFSWKGPASFPDSLSRSVRAVVRPEFLWFVPETSYSVCDAQSNKFPLPQEFASALAFFHMSSVCRYNPEFLAKLVSSNAWPMLLATRRHSLLHSLTSTFSFVTNRNFVLT